LGPSMVLRLGVRSRHREQAASRASQQAAAAAAVAAASSAPPGSGSSGAAAAVVAATAAAAAHNEASLTSTVMRWLETHGGVGGASPAVPSFALCVNRALHCLHGCFPGFCVAACMRLHCGTLGARHPSGARVRMSFDVSRPLLQPRPQPHLLWLSLRCPMRLMPDASLRLESTGTALAEWLGGAAACAALSVVDCTRAIPAPDLAWEEEQAAAADTWCRSAWEHVAQFEAAHPPPPPHSGPRRSSSSSSGGGVGVGGSSSAVQTRVGRASPVSASIAGGVAAGAGTGAGSPLPPAWYRQARPSVLTTLLKVWHQGCAGVCIAISLSTLDKCLHAGCAAFPRMVAATSVCH
jgi:hypothetical protein